MLKAFRIRYTFCALVELSDEERGTMVRDAIIAAEQADRGEDETCVFTSEWQGKVWKLYVDVGRRRVNFMSQVEAEHAGLPGASTAE